MPSNALVLTARRMPTNSFELPPIAKILRLRCGSKILFLIIQPITVSMVNSNAFAHDNVMHENDSHLFDIRMPNIVYRVEYSPITPRTPRTRRHYCDVIFVIY